MRRITLCILMIGPFLAGCGSAAPPDDGYRPVVSVAPVPALVLKPGDRLLVRVAGEEEFDDVFTVSGDGTVHLPLIGSLVAGGQTPGALAEQVRTRLAEGYLKDPSVTVGPVAALMPQQAAAPVPAANDAAQRFASGAPTNPSPLVPALRSSDN